MDLDDVSETSVKDGDEVAEVSDCKVCVCLSY